MTEYINREDIVKAVDKIINKMSTSEEARGYLQAIEHVSDILALMPAADVQPVKHGQWIEVSPKHSRCSVCDTTCLIAVYPISKGANYCPNCGARMDGGDESWKI